MHPRPPAARSMRGKAVMRRHLGEGGVAVVELDERDDMAELQDELQHVTVRAAGRSGSSRQERRQRGRWWRGRAWEVLVCVGNAGAATTT